MKMKKRKSKRSSKSAKSTGTQRHPKAERSSTNDGALRRHLRDLLGGENAHTNFRKAVADFPVDMRGTKAMGVPYTAWQLLEHLRIAQWDILEFSCNSKHLSPPWPEGYWPSSDTPPVAAAWDRSVKAFSADLERMQKLVQNPRTDLFAKIPRGDGQTILRETLLVADHNAYHIGQIVLLRRFLGAWKAN
jgi:DinB superfamily